MKRFIAVITLCLIAVAVFAESRNALLIANGQYQKFSKLAKPVPEAKELAKSLQELGFEVMLIENASFEEMNIEIKKFREKLKNDKGIGFFHYGGHAVQVNGENYLIPINADIPNEDYVPSRTVNVSEVMNSMLAETNIIILDSCRDNPFTGSGRSASRGLQSVKFKPKNSVIVYSAEAGKTAKDGVFTPILAEKIKENQDLLYVLRDVRNEVYNRTNGEQTPGEYNQLMTAVNLCVGIPSRLAQVEAENERLNQELERLRAKKNSSSDKDVDIEIQRIEAESKRKQLELQQVREAEARRAAEEKRLAEEQAKRNENQKKQDEQFAKMQAENAAKLREIEKLRIDQAGLEEMVITANEIHKTISQITADFNSAMGKAIEDTKTFYQNKRNAIKVSKWETNDEFADRKKIEETEINKSENADIAKIKSDYQKEIDGNTASLKRQLQAILDKPVIISGSRIKVEFGEYERNEQRFPFSVTDTQSSQAKYDMYIDVNSKNAAQRNRKCQEIDTNIKLCGYVGYFEYGVIFDEALDKYIADMRGVGLKKLSDNTVVAVLGIEEIKRIVFKKLTDEMMKTFIFVEGGSTCSSLWVYDHEVTQAEWQLVMGNNPSGFKGDNKPVENVSWYDAVEYCNKLSLLQGLTPCYVIDKIHKDPNNNNSYDDIKWTVTWNKSANGYRLPTEVEWEWTAKGGKQNRGYTYSGNSSVGNVAWYSSNSGSTTHDVKTRQKNELGIYDMSGNVWEWCWNWYDGSRLNIKDYSGAMSGEYRIGCGGSWDDDADRCEPSDRICSNPNSRYSSIGFRVVRGAR